LDLKEKFERLKYHRICQSKIESSIQELDTEVKWVSVQVGDGSWSDISKKSEKYRKSPSRKNYEELMDAIKAFDKSMEGNSTHVKSVEEVKEKAQKDRRLAEKIGESKKIFVEDPNTATFANLKIDINNFLEFQNGESYREIDNKFIVNCRSFVAQVSNERGLNFKICLHGFDFKDTDYERWTDYALEITISDEPTTPTTPTWKIGNINKHIWTSNMPYDGYRIKPQNRCINSKDLKIEIKHVMGFRGDTTNTLSKEEIIAFGITGNGSPRVKIFLTRSGGNEKPKYATVSFDFSGLPSLPDEEF
jgi:hypothetical protein